MLNAKAEITLKLNREKINYLAQHKKLRNKRTNIDFKKEYNRRKLKVYGGENERKRYRRLCVCVYVCVVCVCVYDFPCKRIV